MPAWLTLVFSALTALEPLAANLFTAWNTASGTTMQKVAAVIANTPAEQALIAIGQELFPKLAATVGPIAAAAMAALQLKNPSAIQYVQDGLNLIAAEGVIALPKPLVLDGLWGPLTTAAFEAAETKAGLPQIGVLNDAALNWLGVELAKIG